MAKKSKDYSSLMDELKRKMAKDHELASDFKVLEELNKALDGDAFNSEKLKVPYVTADPIFEAPWK